MLSYEDCVGLSGLTAEEVAAIARREHVPEIVALEMAVSLSATVEGERLIRRMIAEGSEEAPGHDSNARVARPAEVRAGTRRPATIRPKAA